MPPFDPDRRRCFVGAFAAVSAASSALLSAPAMAVPALLAAEGDPGIDPAGYLVSEKYDGVRAIWDGRSLRHRSGRPVAAPAPWLAALPPVPLDGELWLERGRFDALSALVRREAADAASWRAVRYLVFELPGAPGPFVDRAARIESVVADAGRGGPLRAVAQERIEHRAALAARLDAVVAAGGEGLMLHRASAPFIAGRSDALVKLKPRHDAEATVLGHRAGKGRLAGSVGALEVSDGEGRRFFVGSGLDDRLRREPPPIGTTIVFRHRGRTATGLPRFATYWRPAGPG